VLCECGQACEFESGAFHNPVTSENRSLSELPSGCRDEVFVFPGDVAFREVVDVVGADAEVLECNSVVLVDTSGAAKRVWGA
jgi:phenylalanyl-tRNA synthetase beta subunit